MRAVIQRVRHASVTVEGESVAAIGKGLLVFLGIGKKDGERDVEWMVDKILHLRVFEDQEGKMNLSLSQIGGELLVVSQFTLYGDCRKGRRPSFDEAAGPSSALLLYEKFVDRSRSSGINTKTGLFQAKMLVNLENDGPVTLVLESQSCSNKGLVT